MKPQPVLSGPALPNIPWEDRPPGNRDVVWRYSRNPVIPRDIIPCANSVFNSAVVPFKNGFAGVFRVDDTSRNMRIHYGRSRDGFAFEIDSEPIAWHCDDPEIGQFVESYDPQPARLPLPLRPVPCTCRCECRCATSPRS